MPKQFDYSKNPKIFYIVEEHVNLLAKLGVAVGFDSSSSINSSNEMLGCKLLPLSRVCLIGDEAPRFCHVACEEESSRDRVYSIGNRHPRYRHASIKVHGVHLILVVISLQING